ncbi:hypothetical protein ACKWMY_25100 [Serratia sp. J2]|uniref:hypothetical protein n=1 Tax=Serratia sp. J2 TaxID=3386551 RepID=UPI0039174B5F
MPHISTFVDLLVGIIIFLAVCKGVFFSKGEPRAIKAMIIYCISFIPFYSSLLFIENLWVNLMFALLNLAAMFVFIASLTSMIAKYMKQRKIKAG